MSKRAIIPAKARPMAEKLRMSPGILSHDFLFMTGVTGSDETGAMPLDPSDQFTSVFAKIESVLQEAGLSFVNIVEMTSYHVGLREHFDVFDRIRQSVCAEPYPAWTAVEVAGLRREGALVEVRVIAHTGQREHD